MDVNKNFRMDPRQENFIAGFAIGVIMMIFIIILV